MKRQCITSACAALLAFLVATRAMPHDPPSGGCGSFPGDFVRELVVMRSAAIPITAKAGSPDQIPQLALDRHYAIGLMAQNQLRFRMSPGRVSRAHAPRGGMFQFEVPASGRYRVSITSRHWIDIVDGEASIPSLNHHGPGCDLVHKIVEFELSSGRPFTLQLSGQDDAIIGLAITAAPSATTQDRS
jgi:hypothetical protein